MSRPLPGSDAILREVLGALGVAHEHYPAGRATGSERVSDDLQRGTSSRAQRRSAVVAIAKASGLFEPTETVLSVTEQALAQWDKACELASWFPVPLTARPLLVLPLLQSLATLAGVAGAAHLPAGLPFDPPKAPSQLGQRVREMLGEVEGRSLSARLDRLNRWLDEHRPDEPPLSRSTIDRWLKRRTHPKATALRRFAEAVSGVTGQKAVEERLRTLRAWSAIDALVGRVDRALGADVASGRRHADLLHERMIGAARFVSAMLDASDSDEARAELAEGGPTPLLGLFREGEPTVVRLVLDLLGLRVGTPWFVARAADLVSEPAWAWADPSTEQWAGWLLRAGVLRALRDGQEDLARTLLGQLAAAPGRSKLLEILHELPGQEPDQLVGRLAPHLEDPQLGPALTASFAPLLAAQTLKALGRIGPAELQEIQAEAHAQVASWTAPERRAASTVVGTLMLAVLRHAAATDDPARIEAVTVSLKRLTEESGLPGHLQAEIARVFEQLDRPRDASRHREAAARAGVLAEAPDGS
jgi:hypothetical protein